MIQFRLVSVVLLDTVQAHAASTVTRLQELNIRSGLVSNTDARMRT